MAFTPSIWIIYLFFARACSSLFVIEVLFKDIQLPIAPAQQGWCMAQLSLEIVYLETTVNSDSSKQAA